MKQPLIKLAAVVAVVFGSVGLIAASPSGAATSAQSCKTVSGSATFSPGLGSTPQNQTVKAKGNETGCTPKAATGGSGALSATIALKNADCTTLISGGQTLTGTGSTKWANGKSSHYNLTFKTGTGNNISVATITGTVSGGLFKGDTITGKISFTVVGSPNCDSKPVKKVTFTNTKPFVIG